MVRLIEQKLQYLLDDLSLFLSGAFADILLTFLVLSNWLTSRQVVVQ